MSRRFLLSLLCLLTIGLVIASPAAAQNPHFVPSDPPEFTDLGTQLQATGSVAGLGNENVDVILEATGIATITCGNPGNNPDVPGQRTEFTVTGQQTDIEVKNGRAFFNVVTAAPVADPAVVCPNRRWTATVTDVEFSSATITVIQPSGSGIVVLEETFAL